MMLKIWGRQEAKGAWWALWALRALRGPATTNMLPTTFPTTLALALTLLTLALTLSPLAAQITDSADRGDHATYRSTASSTSDAFTLQIPASGKTSTILSIQVQCLSATTTATCDVEFQRGGTAATATAAVVNRLNSRVPTATLTAFHSSDAGAGTTINKVQQSVNLPYPYLSGFVLIGTGDKITIRVSSSITQEYRYYVEWKEDR